MGCLLLGVKDDQRICNARAMKEETLLGRGEMLKPAGINWGEQEWKRLVRTRSEGQRGME
jgi:hypothetical protein